MSAFRFPHRWLALLRGSPLDDAIPYLDDRDRAIEDFLSNLESDGDAELLFSLTGDVYLSTSGRYYVQEAGSIVSLVLALGTTGSSTTTVAILKNGVSQTTLSLTSGVYMNSSTPSISLSPGDYLQVQVTLVGTGAKNLLVQTYRG